MYAVYVECSLLYEGFNYGQARKEIYLALLNHKHFLFYCGAFLMREE